MGKGFIFTSLVRNYIELCQFTPILARLISSTISDIRIQLFSNNVNSFELYKITENSHLYKLKETN